MSKVSTVYSLFGMESPQQVAARRAKEMNQVYEGVTSPYESFGISLGSAIGRMLSGPDPEMARAQKREAIAQDISSQFARQAAQPKQAPEFSGVMKPPAPPTPDQQLRDKYLADAERYSAMTDRYTAEGMLQEAEITRTMTQESMKRAMDIDTALLDQQAKQQQIASSKQGVIQSQQQVKASIAGEERAEDEASRKTTAETERTTARTKLLNIAGNEAALKDIGFGDAMAARIAGSPNKEAYLEAIDARLKKMGEDAGAITEPTTKQREHAQLMKLITDRRAALDEGNQNKADMLGIEINALGAQLGITSPAFEKVVVQSLEAVTKASELDVRSSSLIAKIDANKEKMKSGAPAIVDEGLRAVFGDQGRYSVLMAEYANIRNSSVLQYLPPGVASDRDVSLVLEGTIDRYSSPEAMMAFLRGVQKIAAAEKKYHEARLDYLSRPELFKDPTGFQRQWREDQYNARTDALRELGYTDEEALRHAETPLEFFKAVEAKKDPSGTRMNNLKSRLGIN